MKYIDADLLRKEIEFAKTVYDNPNRVVYGVADAFRQDGRAAMCDDILKKLDSLQPEQPVEGLEEEFARFKELNRWGYKEVDREFVRSNGWRLQVSDIMNIARHFAEWGARHLKK